MSNRRPYYVFLIAGYTLHHANTFLPCLIYNSHSFFFNSTRSLLEKVFLLFLFISVSIVFFMYPIICIVLSILLAVLHLRIHQPQGRIQGIVGKTKSEESVVEMEAHYLNHPLIEKLPSLTREEYGYSYEGAIG